MHLIGRTLFAVLVLTSIAVAAPAAEAYHGRWIQPGELTATDVGSCTLNFVFDGVENLTGRVFIGTAAHCVRTVGAEVDLASISRAGVVYYIGDTPNAINGDGRGDNGYPGAQLDFALIEVKPVNHAHVIADVKGRAGMPTGTTVHTETANREDLVLLSGYGTGFHVVSVTRESRLGPLWNDNTRTFNAYAPASPGDSGGPVLHESGKALGVASTVGTNGLAGPTMQGVLDEIEDLGIFVEMRTV